MGIKETKPTKSDSTLMFHDSILTQSEVTLRCNDCILCLSEVALNVNVLILTVKRLHMLMNVVNTTHSEVHYNPSWRHGDDSWGLLFINMGSYFELVKPTNYKYGLIFKISELQNPELPLITKICKSEDSTTEFIWAPRDVICWRVCNPSAAYAKSYLSILLHCNTPEKYVF